MDIKKKIKNLPSLPGVYLMKDSQNNIIYVGKSKNLKSRVGSYFTNSKSHSPKVLKLVKNIKDLEYIVTDTEFDAFMLECKLIKEIKPHYNSQMKSPMSYAYIKINMNEKYPSIEVTHSCYENDGCLYWGPYRSKNTLDKGVHGIKEHLKILCSGNHSKPSACLNYSLGLCKGMCFEKISRKQYLNIVNKIMGLLNGTHNGILEEMNNTMNSFAEKLDFEKAAKYRDYVRAVKYIVNSARIIEFTEENNNFALLEYLNNNAIKFFLIKGNRVLYSQKYEVNPHNLNELLKALREEVILYFKDNGDSVKISKIDVDESLIIYAYLKDKNSNCRYALIPEEWVREEKRENIEDALNKIFEPCEAPLGYNTLK